MRIKIFVGGIRSVKYTIIHLCTFVSFCVVSNCSKQVMDRLKNLVLFHHFPLFVLSFSNHRGGLLLPSHAGIWTELLIIFV